MDSLWPSLSYPKCPYLLVFICPFATAFGYLMQLTELTGIPNLWMFSILDFSISCTLILFTDRFWNEKMGEFS